MTQPRLVGGRYELGELIGYGGMAEVHRGRDTRLNREVAIKVLRADLARDPSFLNRFRREAHSSAGLNHPSIVSVYDTGEDAGADGTSVPFIVMEFVDGRTLRDILKSEGKLPARRAMEITADICAALDFSHRNGIVHRDIKPANVMITPNGAVKVMDFGIARAVADTSATVTQTANVIGTAQYLSPEQARGESVDARSDVYSTGCLFYELVTGVPPFQGDSPVAVAYQHVRENPVAPSARNPEVPRSVDSIIMKALAKNQLNRYQSAGDMRADIQRALADQPVTAESVMTDAERTQFIARTPPPPVAPRPAADDEQPPDNTRRTALIWVAVVVALLLVIGAAAYGIVKLGSDSKSAKMVAVPSVVGQTKAAAVAAIKAKGLLASPGADTPGPCDGPTPAEGYVCTVSPVVGQKVKENTVVVYHLYARQLYPVPYVVGMTLAKAAAGLAAVHLGFTEKDVNDPSAKGTVLTQAPQSGEAPAGTKVVLTVSTGKVVLPDVKGKQLDDAQLAIAQANFTTSPTLKSATTSVKSKDNTVKSESPTPKVAYAPNEQITLTIYHYKKPLPTCPSTPASPTTGTSSATTPPPGQPGAPATSTSPAPSVTPTASCTPAG